MQNVRHNTGIHTLTHNHHSHTYTNTLTHAHRHEHIQNTHTITLKTQLTTQDLLVWLGDGLLLTLGPILLKLSVVAGFAKLDFSLN